MTKKQVKVGDSVNFALNGIAYSGIVQKTDNADEQQVVVGDLSPAISGQQTITLRYHDLINPAGTKVGFVHAGKRHTGIVQPAGTAPAPKLHQIPVEGTAVVVSSIDPPIPGVPAVSLDTHEITDALPPGAAPPIEHQQVHAGGKPPNPPAKS